MSQLLPALCLLVAGVLVMVYLDTAESREIRHGGRGPARRVVNHVGRNFPRRVGHMISRPGRYGNFYRHRPRYIGYGYPVVYPGYVYGSDPYAWYSNPVPQEVYPQDYDPNNYCQDDNEDGVCDDAE
ncbi:uncharacterized protein LOC129596841 [Paramacrobiotus metropolitanus]|uniref:uncharacterized protein LOC129596841 n=1 Tax=Paramacrobiotus metropolitanus TaxID=2943436 RepID=UPI0024456F64|nr:uncharacterized protein LOC129596841 [Paramacrobiotus metropolitanus]